MSVIATCAVLALGLTGGQKATAPAVYGDWVTLTSSKDVGKEVLHLDKAGTFVLKLTPTLGTVETAKGKFDVRSELPPGSKVATDRSVYLLAQTMNGKAVPQQSVPPKKLAFYSKGPILVDDKMTVFCHPGDEARVLKLFMPPKKK